MSTDSPAPPPRGLGRPSTGNAKSNADRQRDFRNRRKETHAELQQALETLQQTRGQLSDAMVEIARLKELLSQAHEKITHLRADPD